jgi:hypothetical protein
VFVCDLILRKLYAGVLQTRICAEHEHTAEDPGPHGATNGRRGCKVHKYHDGAHNVCGNRTPRANSFVVFVTLHLTVPPVEHVDSLSHSRIRKAHVSLP